MINPLTAIFIVIGITIIIIFAVGNDKKSRYEMWYADLIKMAPSYGFTEKDIENFTKYEFRNYFDQGMDVEKAIKHYLADN